MQVWNLLHAVAGNAGPKSHQKSPSGHHRTTLSGYIFATKARIDNRKKNLLSSNMSSRCPHNMVNFGPLTAEIGLGVWGTLAGFASWQHYCTAVKYWASAKLCGVEQRAPPMFGRASITLGIGPHSSCTWSTRPSDGGWLKTRQDPVLYQNRKPANNYLKYFSPETENAIMKPCLSMNKSLCISSCGLYFWKLSKWRISKVILYIASSEQDIPDGVYCFHSYCTNFAHKLQNYWFLAWAVWTWWFRNGIKVVSKVAHSLKSDEQKIYFVCQRKWI